MARIAQQHSTLAARFLPRVALAVLVALLLATSAADAALTTGKCLAQKRAAWATLRKCQGTEEAKQLKGKPADLAQCLTKFQNTLAKISARATKAEIVCRYRDNGDHTVTDFDTGWMWERKNVVTVTQTVTWPVALTDFLGGCNGTSTDGTTLGAGCSIYRDWRIPTILELQTLVDTSRPGCRTGVACIDSIFEPTVASYYWSATTYADVPGFAWGVYFGAGYVNYDFKGNDFYVRAVRTGL